MTFDPRWIVAVLYFGSMVPEDREVLDGKLTWPLDLLFTG